MTQEFVHDVSDAKDAYKLLMAYDGSGRRISKTRMVKDDQRGYWYTDYVTHYTGIGTEVRESIRRAASPEVKVVVNLPQGLGRYGVEDAADPFKGIDKEKLAGYIPSTKFEWYLKNHQGESSENDLDHFHCRAAGFYAMRLNHLGSTMLVYGTQSTSRPDIFDQGGVQAAYDYRAFGEQVDLEQKGDKVTENFTGKERDDETELNYFGARYLDPMLGLWVSVDPKRQFASPYLYAGNGMNPIGAIDPDGNFTLGAQVRGSASTPTGYSASAGTTFSVMIDFDRLKAGKWPVLYSKSVDVGSGIGGGVGASAGFFFNSSSPQIGSYTTAHVDLSAKAGIGIGGSVTPPEAGDGRYDVMLSGGIGYEGYVGVTLEHGDIQEFHPKDAINNMFESKLKDMAENPEDYAE